MEERYNNDQFIQGNDTQESPKQWDDLSLTEKNAFIANAVKHGIINMEDIRKAYDELAQGNMNDYALQDNMNEEISPYNDDGSSIDQDSANVFLKGGYKPSRYIKSFISHMEGSSMNTNRSFDAEARDFWDAIPQDIRKKITQQQADALYSYSYNVGAGNFKKRVIPALQNYFNGTGSIDKVQRSMWASKDNQLRGLANRRAQERAMFAGSEVPVYYGNEHNNAYTPQYSNAWRDSRLGPVTSINMSRGLGVVDNNAMRGSAMLGPVSTRQDNSMMKEAIDTLYDDSAKQAISPVTQEQESSLDRYNEIQDYLLSMSPFSFSNGGKIYADGGVTSTNGLYHVNPSDYGNVLSTVANDQPVEVTLPDTTVTATDPNSYRSYYDPNGAGDFLDATTLGLFPNPFNLSKSASTFMQHPSWGSAWDTTKDALMFAGSTGKEAAFAPLGLMNLIDKDGVRKTYGLAKDGNYAGAVMSGLGDVLNAVMVAWPAYTVGKNVGKGLYNLYDNGTLFDKYTTFQGRFGNYSDNLLTNMYATYARRFGLPDKARIPADAIRKIRGGVNITDNGMIDFTGNKGYGGNPHTNVTLDRPVVSHLKGNWDGADTYLLSTRDLLSQAQKGSLKSIEPSDMFVNGSKIIEEPNKVTVISGDANILENAKKAGMQTLSSPKLRRMYKEAETEYLKTANKRFKLNKHPQDRANIAYATEIQRLQSMRGNPTLKDMRLLEKQTGLNAGVAPISEYSKAIESLNNMITAKNLLSIKPYVYPNGREVEMTPRKINNELELLNKAKYNNIFYDPATWAEFNWKTNIGLE